MAGARRDGKSQASKPNGPSKSQTSKSQKAASAISARSWDFGFAWDLGFGDWNFRAGR
jgi:hypothetical protein